MAKEVSNVEEKCRDFRKKFDAVRKEIGKVIVGHGDIVEDVLVGALPWSAEHAKQVHVKG